MNVLKIDHCFKYSTQMLTDSFFPSQQESHWLALNSLSEQKRRMTVFLVWLLQDGKPGTSSGGLDKN